MNRSNGEKPHDLKELVARALFQDQHPYQSWDRSKEYMKANSKRRAEVAMKRCGMKNVELVTEIQDPKEGARE